MERVGEAISVAENQFYYEYLVRPEFRISHSNKAYQFLTYLEPIIVYSDSFRPPNIFSNLSRPGDTRILREKNGCRPTTDINYSCEGSYNLVVPKLQQSYKNSTRNRDLP